MPPQDGKQDRAETTGFVSAGKRDGDESTEGQSVEIEGGKAGELRMRVGKYVCPTKFVNTFTPMEFEEVVHLFMKYDADDSGELDVSEMLKLVSESDIEYDLADARKLLEKLDEDQSGLIDFAEFCAFIARVKAGDEKLRRFATLAEALNATPAVMLEQQCQKRNIKVSYHVIGVRPATSANPHKHFVMEVRLEGEWIDPCPGGGTARWVGTKRFQGIEKSTRAGRMKAAEAALTRMRCVMPGVDVPSGVIPGEWTKWLKHNSRNGVRVNRLLTQLCAKGFAPNANPSIMHWALATASLGRLLEAHPTASPTEDDGREFGPQWREWLGRCLSMGFDPAVLVEVVQERGVETARMEGAVQRLRRGEGSTGADPVNPRLLDFWQCCGRGYLCEVELYLCAGQSPDDGALCVPRGITSSPLALAAVGGSCDVVDALVAAGAELDGTDSMGRTALHHAAKSGEVEVCRRLLEHGASLNATDSAGCAPLHMAARYNQPQCCELLAFHGEETVRSVVSDRIPVARKPFTQIMEEAFHRLMDDRLRPNETRRFRKAWVRDAVLWCRDQLHSAKKHLLQKPSRELVDYVVGRFDPDPDAGFWKINAGHRPTFVPMVAEPWHLSDMMRHVLRLAVCGYRDGRGWTALHQACMENCVCSHKETIRVLVMHHQLDLHQVDKNGKLAVDLLLFDGGRPETPSGSVLRESLLMDRRKDVLDEVNRYNSVDLFCP